MKVKRETTFVGDIAPSGHGPLGITTDLDPKQTRKRDKKRKQMNSKGNNKGNPPEFKQLEHAANRTKKQVVEEMVKEQLFSLIVEQGNTKQVMDLYDNIGKMLSLSLQYARMFMADSMKLGSDAVEFNYKRAKAELSRVYKLVKDMDQVLLKVYQQYKAEEEAEQRKDSNDEFMTVDAECSKRPMKEVSPPGFKGTVKAMKKHKEIDNPFALAWSMKNKGTEAHYKNRDGTPEKKAKYKNESINLQEGVEQKVDQLLKDKGWKLRFKREHPQGGNMYAKSGLKLYLNVFPNGEWVYGWGKNEFHGKNEADLTKVIDKLGD